MRSVPTRHFILAADARARSWLWQTTAQNKSCTRMIVAWLLVLRAVLSRSNAWRTDWRTDRLSPDLRPQPRATSSREESCESSSARQYTIS